MKYFLVHTLMYSNKDAQLLIDGGCVKIDGATILTNEQINDTSEIKVNDAVAREKKEFVYIKFNKPAGFESTLNEKVPQNIACFFKKFNNLSIAGRLDKASEGLLLLSNDGKWVESICNPKFEKEKEYLVTLSKPVTDEFIDLFKSGVAIDKFITKKCICNKINETIITAVLTEGKNRQIRKMCKVLGYTVIKLNRTKVDTFLLGELGEGEFEIMIL